MNLCPRLNTSEQRILRNESCEYLVWIQINSIWSMQNRYVHGYYLFLMGSVYVSISIQKVVTNSQ